SNEHLVEDIRLGFIQLADGGPEQVRQLPQDSRLSQTRSGPDDVIQFRNQSCRCRYTHLNPNPVTGGQRSTPAPLKTLTSSTCRRLAPRALTFETRLPALAPAFRPCCTKSGRRLGGALRVGMASSR